MTEPRRRLRWLTPKGPVPAHPYRDSMIFYALLAVGLVVVAALIGSDVVRAAVIACVCFVLASGWSALHWRQAIREENRKRGWEES